MVGRLFAAADSHAELERDLGACLQREELHLGVQHLDAGLGHVLALHLLGAGDLHAQDAGLVGRHLHGELLEIQQDVGQALGDAGHLGVVGAHAVDLHPRDGGAGHDGQQRAPERIADRQRVALLEGLGHQAAVAVAQDLPLDLLRLLKRNPRHGAPYLLYSSTISCSVTGSWMSSRSGRPRMTPRLAFTSTSSHCGICPRPALALSSTRGPILEVGRSCTTSPTLARNEGTVTLRPLTWKWPWATIWRDSRREAAKPRR